MTSPSVEKITYESTNLFTRERNLISVSNVTDLKVKKKIYENTKKLSLEKNLVSVKSVVLHLLIPEPY